MFLTVLCIPIEDEAGEVSLWEVNMACGEKVVGFNRAPTSRDYISGMLDGDVIFISFCFVILYIIKTSMLIYILCSYYADTMLLVFVLCSYIYSPFVKIPQKPKNDDFLESDDK